MSDLNKNLLDRFKLNFCILDAMDDLVRIRDMKGDTVYENSSMKKAIREIYKGGKNSRIVKRFYDLSNPMMVNRATIKRLIDIDDKTFSVKVSPIIEEGVTTAFVEVFRDVTIENRISRELFIANRKINNDVSLAKNIQKSILPRRINFKNIHFQYAHIPSDNLSGDIFDVVEIDSDRFGVYIADVVGHGISASIMTMFIRQTVKNILTEFPRIGPSDTLKELKRRFTILNLGESQYFTIIYMLVDTKKDSLKYVNAGHNCMPLIFNDRNLGFMYNKGLFISSYFPEVDYLEKEIKLNTGDKILLYTDGLIETVNKDGKYFGQDGLRTWIKNNRKNPSMLYSLERHLNSYRWLEQKDDVAMLYMDIREKI